MNKLHLILLLVTAAMLILSACGGSAKSWDEEAVVASDRILADNVEAAWTVEPEAAAGAGETIRLTLSRTDGRSIDGFDITHEKLLHLIVVSQDLSYFAHIHPEHLGEGVFEVANDFPAGGAYRLIADFKPTGGDSMTKMAWVDVSGEPAEQMPVAPDGVVERVANGTRVALAAADGGAEDELSLTFTLTEEASGEPVTDLEPYLGAIGHVVLLSADGEKYVHVHAEEGQGTGPTAAFEATLPGSGVYKVWGQFQRDGEVFTVPYVLDVAE